MNSVEKIAEIDKKSNELKEKIKKSTPKLEQNILCYYISENGDDSNDGKSIEHPFRSIERLNSEKITEKANVLFERGGTWRGRVVCSSDVTYSSYGDENLPKPIIIGSKRNYADTSLWKKTDRENVYVCTERLSDVGIIAIDHNFKQIGYPDNSEIVAIKRLSNDLYNDLEFYSDLETDELFIYSLNGNPGYRFLSIEIGERNHIITVGDKNNIVIDGLSLKYTGGHAISGSGGTNNLTVRNCEIRWIGGAVHTGLGDGKSIQYGNAVEIYGPLSGFYVYNNYISDIYDTAVTFQFSYCDASIDMNNVEFHHNLIERCHWSIEWYNQPTPGYERTVRNINIHHNICRYNGYGWGSRFRRNSAMTVVSCFLPEKTEDFYFRNNILDRCTGSLIHIHAGGDEKIVFEDNELIQIKGRKLQKLFSDEILFADENAMEVLIENHHIGTTLTLIKE